MKKLLVQLWQLKPSSLPSWLFGVLIFFLLLLALGAASVGAWVLLTQIDYM